MTKAEVVEEAGRCQYVVQVEISVKGGANCLWKFFVLCFIARIWACHWRTVMIGYTDHHLSLHANFLSSCFSY